MRRVVSVVLLLGWPAYAQAQLTPSKELEARLQALEARRAPIETRRAQSFGLRVGAGIGYGLALACVIWAIAELARQTTKTNPEPLGGVPSMQGPVVQPLWMFVAASLFAVASAAVHLTSRSLSVGADEAELALEEEEGPLRRQLAWDRDKPAE